MKTIRKLCFLLATLTLVSTHALAADYSFITSAPQDYYGGTSYEDVYGAQYNYGGPNAVDFLDPLAESVATAMAGDGVQYGLSDMGGDAVFQVDSSGNTFPVLWDASFNVAVTQYTDAGTMVRSDGSIGTLKIPSLGINMKVWEGETTDSMAKGVGHYSSTSGWNGNICLCGHNRGATYVIGSIKDLKLGDTITYTTVYGTRTYTVSMVTKISSTDWGYLQRTTDNRITITTCVAGDSSQRWCVQGTEVHS